MAWWRINKRFFRFAERNEYKKRLEGLLIMFDVTYYVTYMFDTYFTEKMMAGNKSVGFSNWVKNVQPRNYYIWLLPVLVNNNHWTLLVITLRQRIMIYFDSFHKLPPQLLIDRICSFISNSRTARHDKVTQWSKWVLSAPIDIPEQSDEYGRITGNRGVHVRGVFKK